MYFGELAEKSLDFQKGHLVGGRRMAENLIRMAEKEFEGVENKKQIVEFLKTEASNWTCHCTTYGMGEGEETD